MTHVCLVLLVTNITTPSIKKKMGNKCLTVELKVVYSLYTA